MAITQRQRRLRIKKRLRNKINGTPERPRLSVYRSNTGIYAQVIDDTIGKTLAHATWMDFKEAKASKTEYAQKVGKKLAELAKEKGVSKVVFDRNGYRYHGRVKALADAAREGGLEF